MRQLMGKKGLFGFVLLFFMLQISGCASLQKDMATFFDKLTGKQAGTREEAVMKYGYSGQRDVIFAEPPVITPAVARPGDTIVSEFQYSLLAPQKDKSFVVSEVVILSSSRETMNLVKREAVKPQGTHVSTLQFTIPKDLDAGKYKITSSLSAGSIKKTVQGEFVVRQ
jgi:hypothetical protein